MTWVPVGRSAWSPAPIGDPWPGDALMWRHIRGPDSLSRWYLPAMWGFLAPVAHWLILVCVLLCMFSWYLSPFFPLRLFQAIATCVWDLFWQLFRLFIASGGQLVSPCASAQGPCKGCALIVSVSGSYLANNRPARGAFWGDLAHSPWKGQWEDLEGSPGVSPEPTGTTNNASGSCSIGILSSIPVPLTERESGPHRPRSRTYTRRPTDWSGRNR